MSLNSIKNAVPLCFAFGEEDGVDPRYAINKSARHKSTRKQFQLCKEASRVFSLVLAGETKQTLLRDLWLLSVEPDGNGQCLCVTLGYAAGDIVTEEQVHAAVSSVQGLLRSALAQAVNRKRIPALNFRYVGIAKGV